MTTRTRTRTAIKWIPGTRMARQAAPLPVVNKPFTIGDEINATLGDWLNAYGYLLQQKDGYLWLTGLVKNDQREQVAAKVCQQLAQAKAGGVPGDVLVKF